jgi:hypothetical protein
VADEPLHDPELASGVRDLADATDRALRGDDPAMPLARATGSLAGSSIAAAQLRQLHADLMRRDR